MHRGMNYEIAFLLVAIHYAANTWLWELIWMYLAFALVLQSELQYYTNRNKYRFLYWLPDSKQLKAA